MREFGLHEGLNPYIPVISTRCQPVFTIHGHSTLQFDTLYYGKTCKYKSRSFAGLNININKKYHHFYSTKTDLMKIYTLPCHFFETKRYKNKISPLSLRLITVLTICTIRILCRKIALWKTLPRSIVPVCFWRNGEFTLFF